jgi:RNA polymerase sigma-70 factor (ECF subfamily)
MTTEQTVRTNELVARAQQGDADAFATLYEAFAPLVFSYLRRRMNGPAEAVEDLTADVFVRVYEKLDRYVDRGLPFSAWLFRMAHNQLIDDARKHARATFTSLDHVTEVTEPADEQAGQEYRQILDRETLEPALAQLTREQRQVLELRFLQGLSVAEAAAVLERSEDAVKKLQARGLMSLRRILTTSRRTITGRRRAEIAA